MVVKHRCKGEKKEDTQAEESFLLSLHQIMDDNLYDEFGNYIGPDLNEDSSEEVSV